MKNVLKIMMFFCMLTILLPTFAGGEKDGNTDKGSEPVVITYWYGATVTEAGPPPPDWVALKIIREKLNIDLRLTALPSSESDQDVKIQAAGAANSLPDLFYVRRDPWLNLIKQGLVSPIDEIYDLMPVRTGQHYNADSKTYTTINGKSYGLASPGSIIAKNEGVLIRKDWLAKLGLKVPVTTEDYFNVMKAFTYNDPDGNGKNDTWGYGAFIEVNNYEEGLGRRMEPFMGAFGVPGTWNMTETAAGLNVRKPAYHDALAYVKRLVDEKVLDPNWMSYNKDDFRAAWKQGRFGIMREQMAAFSAESNYAPFDKNFPKGEWILIDPPKGPTGKQSVGVYTIPYRIHAISSSAAKAGKIPAIARLLEWMASDEGYYLLGWGEKGINYLLDENGVPTVKDLPDPAKGYTKPEMQPITQLRNMVYYNSRIELLSRYPTYKTAVSGKTINTLALLADMQSRAWTPVIGSDTLPIPNADLKRFYEQGILEFLTGKRQLSKANWDTWVTEFDKLGGAEWDKKGVESAKANGLLIK